MANRRGFLLLALAFLARGQAPEGSMALTLSMERPNAHYYHITFRCDGLAGDTQDFKMPAWTPGYYRIMDYAKNVVNFRAADGGGHALAWQKAAKNTWRVASRNAPSITVSYDVYAFTPFVAESYLDETRGYITPASLFLQVAGNIMHPVTRSSRPYSNWTRISTGLQPVPGRPNTLSPPDVDILFHAPHLMR